MDMKKYLQQATSDEREALAKAVQSSVGYFYLIAGGHRRAGTDLCQRLVDAEPKLSLGDLRPDIWKDQPDQPDASPSEGKSNKEVRREADPGYRQPADPKQISD